MSRETRLFCGELPPEAAATRGVYPFVEPSFYWTGKGHGIRYVCEFCGSWYLKPKELHRHIQAIPYGGCLVSNWWWFIFAPLVILLSIAGGILGHYVYKRWFGPRWFPMLYEPQKLNRCERVALDREMLARWGRMANDAEIEARLEGHL